MSKKMWNRIFKTKSSKNAKSLAAANKVNKRCSIYEEYQQLNAALDLSNNSEKCASENKLITSYEDKPLPTTLLAKAEAGTGEEEPPQTTFNKVVTKAFTLKRSPAKDATLKTGNEKGKSTNSESTSSLSQNVVANVINNNNNNNGMADESTAKIFVVAASDTNASNNYNNGITITANHNNFIAGNINNNNKYATGGGSDGNVVGGCGDAAGGGTPPPYASLSHQLTATSANKPIKTVEIYNNNNNSNNNENEPFACKNLISKPTITTTSPSTSTSTCKMQQRQISKIVIVVRKLNTSTSTSSSPSPRAIPTTASDLATNQRNNPTATNFTTNNANATATTSTTTPTTTTTTTTADVNSYTTTTPTEAPDPSVSVQLAPCPICSRTFNPVTLRKHVGICEKMATKRRNIFDSSRQRREGTELATYPLPKNFGLPEKGTSTSTLTRTKSERGHSPNPLQQVSSPIMQRKEPTKEFIRSTARTSMRKLSTSSATEGMTTSSNNFSRDRLRSSERSLTRRGGIQPLPAEQCPHCDRCFGIKAYDRHVEWCKEKALQASIKQQANTKTEENIAKARLEARTKYRAPCLKTKRSINRDKYSGENEDSPKALKIGNKSHDTSLMSMSMTSSITSERKNTKATGNINEAAPAKTLPIISEAAAEASTPSINISNHSRDKSHTPPPPPPPQAKSEDLSLSDSIANFEIEMPDFRLMGEQMPTSASNNNRQQTTTKGKPSTTTTTTSMKAKEKANVPAATTTKSKQQLKIKAAARNDLKLEAAAADVMHTHAAPQKKKPPSDLSLKLSMRQAAHFRELPPSHKGAGSFDDHGDDIRPKPEGRSSSPVRTVDLAKSLTFHASPPKEIGKIVPTTTTNTTTKAFKSTRKEQLNRQPKMTMEEYFGHDNNESNDIEIDLKASHSLEDERHDDVQENRILGSKKIISSRKDVKKKEYKRKDINLRINEVIRGTPEISKFLKQPIKSTREHFRETCDDMIMQQSYTRSLKTEDEDDMEEDEEDTYVLTNKVRSPSLTDILKTQSKEKSHGEKDVLLVQNKRNLQKTITGVETPKCKRVISKENLSDEIYSKSSTPKRSPYTCATPTRETLQKAYKVLENLELNAGFPDSEVVRGEMNRQRLRKTSNCDKVQHDEVQHDLMMRLNDLSDASEEDDNEQVNALKSSSSTTETFVKTDSETEEDFVTPPPRELSEEDFLAPPLENPREVNEDDFRSLKPNFRSFSPPMRKVKTPTAIPLEKEDKRPMTVPQSKVVALSKSQEALLEIPRVLNQRRVRATTPPPPPPAALSESLDNTPRSAVSLSSYKPQTKLETSPIKSLSICRPRRRNMQPQAADSTQPMKALPLTKQTIEIYGISSATHISQEVQLEQQQQEDERKMEADDEVETEQFNEMEENEVEDPAVEYGEIKVHKESALPQLKRSESFVISGLPDNYDPFLSAKRQLEELCSPTDTPTTKTTNTTMTTTPQTPQLPSLPATPAASTNKMTTSLTLSSSATSTPNSSSPMTTSQTSKTPTLARSSSFRRTGSLRCPRRSPLLTQRVPLFAQKHRPTIQRGLSDEGPISTNFMKPEEYDEMPVRSVCVNDYAVAKSPRVVRRDTSASNRKQPLKLNINAANEAAAGNSSCSPTPNVIETESAPNTASRYVNKTDSLAVFLKYEHELEKLNKATNAEIKKDIVADHNGNTASTATAAADLTATGGVTNKDGTLNAKELKDKSNNLSKQNSAKNIKADIMDHLNETNENCEINNRNNNHIIPPLTPDCSDNTKYNSVRLAPLSKPSTPLINQPNLSGHLTKPSTPLTKPSTPLTKPSTPLTKPSTPLTQPLTPLTPLNAKTLLPLEQQIKPQLSQKPVALSSLFGASKTSEERKNSVGSEYIDPKLINKCDNLPVNLNKLRNEFKNSDSDNSEPRRLDHFSSSSSSESSSAPPTKFLPSVKPDNNNITNNPNQNLHPSPPQQPPAVSQRNSAEGRNLLKRRIRLGRNQFLYDASPEADSCSADDEANRSSMECDNFMKEHEKAFDRLSAQMNNLEAPFIPPPSLPAEFEDFDFEEFLSSFENDEEQFPLFKDCREFLLNRTSKKQRSMLMPNSNVNVVAQSQKSMSQPQQTFPPLTPTQHNQHAQPHPNPNPHPQQQSFQFPNLPQHPKGLFDSFSLNNRATKNRYNDIAAPSENVSAGNQNQKREIFISIETEHNDLDKAPMSPNSIRHMMGNPQCVVEVEVDAADNKFSKISDDDEHVEHGHLSSGISRIGGGGGNHFNGHLDYHHLPNVQLNNAKNLIQKMQEDFRQMGEAMSANLRQSLEQQRSSVQGDLMMMMNNHPHPHHHHQRSKVNKATGTPSGDAYADSDELSSLDGYPLSSPNSRLGVSSKTSADSAYGSLSRQRSSELSTNPRSSSRSNRPLTANNTTGNALIGRPLTEERSRQLSASSSSSSEHALPPIGGNNNYQKQQQHHQQQQHLTQLYNNNNNNNGNVNVTNDLDEMLRYERNNNNNNNNFDVPIHPTIINPVGLTSTPTTTAQQQHHHSNHETPMSSSTQLYGSNSTMSSSMKMSKFCHECGSKFLIEQAKFCMDCGVKRICL